MSHVLTAIAQVAILTFVLTSMVGLGLSLAVRQILAPLKDLKLVGLGLVTSFVVAPAAAWGVAARFALDDSQSLGLLLLGVAAERRSCPSSPSSPAALWRTRWGSWCCSWSSRSPTCR